AAAAEPAGCADDGAKRDGAKRIVFDTEMSCPFAGMTRIRFKGFPRCPYCVLGRGGVFSYLPELPSAARLIYGPAPGWERGCIGCGPARCVGACSPDGA